MSKTANPTYKIIRDGDEKTFEDKQQFEDTRDLLSQNDVDFDVEVPDNPDAEDDLEPEQTEDAQLSDEGKRTAQAEVVKETDEKATEPVESSAEPDVVDSETLPEEPPERNLSDDPVQWFGNIGEFTYSKNGTTAINKKGLRVLQYWYDIGNPDSEVVVGPEDTDHTFARVRAEAEMPDGRTAVAHGSAHVDRGDDPWLLTEMADTRAKSRVILDITGMGAVAISELENEL